MTAMSGGRHGGGSLGEHGGGGGREAGSDWWQYKGKFGPFGRSLDIYKAIGRLPKPKSGRKLSEHKCTGPYNPIRKQLRHERNTEDILEIWDQPIGRTDAIAMQQDVDYSVCKKTKSVRMRSTKRW